MTLKQNIERMLNSEDLRFPVQMFSSVVSNPLNKVFNDAEDESKSNGRLHMYQLSILMLAMIKAPNESIRLLSLRSTDITRETFLTGIIRSKRKPGS